jgi:hypothetical protein
VAAEFIAHRRQQAVGERIDSRERRRSSSDRVITGAGTSSAMASATVQRPSPESSTYGAMPSSDGLRLRASVLRSSSHERTTLPWRHTSATWARSSSISCLRSISAKPSA